MKLTIRDMNVIPESCNGFMVVDEDREEGERGIYTCDTREEAERFVEGKQKLGGER